MRRSRSAPDGPSFGNLFIPGDVSCLLPLYYNNYQSNRILIRLDSVQIDNVRNSNKQLRFENSALCIGEHNRVHIDGQSIIWAEAILLVKVVMRKIAQMQTFYLKIEKKYQPSPTKEILQFFVFKQI